MTEFFDVTDVHKHLHTYKGDTPFHLFKEERRWAQAASLCGRETRHNYGTDWYDEGYVLLTKEQRSKGEDHKEDVHALGFTTIDLPWSGEIDFYRNHFFCSDGLFILAKVPSPSLTDTDMLQIVRYITRERNGEKGYHHLERISGPAWVLTGLHWFPERYNIATTTMYYAHTLNLRAIRFHPYGSLTTVGDHSLLLF